MEKIQVKEELKQEYVGLVRAAQSMEQSIGASEYRLYKMKGQREQVDIDLKSWWDKVAEEYKLDKAQDYYVDNEGSINKVEKPAAPTAAPVAPVVDPDVVAPTVVDPVVEEAKEAETVEDLT